MTEHKKKIKKLFVKFFARKLFQPIFRRMHWISLRGMNYGGGFSPYDSGELFFLNYVKKHSSEIIKIMDIGANTGQYALLCNKIFDTSCIIYSFEPTANSFQKLKINTERIDNIHSYNLGMGESSKKSRIYYSKPGSVQSSLFRNNFSELSENIELTTIDEFCSKNGIEKINILKLDVEGYEFQVLKGAKKFINTVEYIQFEFGNKQVLSRNFLNDFIVLLSEFKIYRLLQDGFIEIDSDPINEIFQTSNYVGINKRIC